MVSYNPVKFGGHRHTGSGDTVFLVVASFRKTLGWKHTAYHINNFNAGDTLKAAIGENFENNFNVTANDVIQRNRHCKEKKLELHSNHRC